MELTQQELNAIAIAMKEAVQKQSVALYGSSYKAMSAPTPLNTIYGRRSIFGQCTEGDIWGMQYAVAGLQPWLGIRPTDTSQYRVDFISWWGPEGTATGDPTAGGQGPCAAAPTWEYGDCGYNQCFESWYANSTKAIDPRTLALVRKCETSRRIRLNGVLIQDEMEWQMQGIQRVMGQVLDNQYVHGTHSNAYQMNGLNSLIRTGYTDKDGQPCPLIDSILVDWQNDDLDGAVNGLGNFFDYLDLVIQEIEAKASPHGTIRETDLALFTSRAMAYALLNSFACYSVCAIDAYTSDPAFRPQVNAYRRSLVGGPLFDGDRAIGFIHLKSGRRLPIMVHDAITLSDGTSANNYCSDVYLLTRSIGGLDTFWAEHLNMNLTANAYNRYPTGGNVPVADASGRWLFTNTREHFCLNLEMGTAIELHLEAPWAQVRFEDVCFERARKPFTTDPFQSTFNVTQGAFYPAQAYDPTCTDDPS